MNLRALTQGTAKIWSGLKASESDQVLQNQDQPTKTDRPEQPAYTRVYVMGTS